ncbi:DMSO-membrane protein [Azorhizobium oxalatiphilum]|uniref:DMSO-membrane protein n=1 Tax=Azorhizobium oxalatiphilum TaxID=980631 RepID=A0A917FE00_9HYPH|nr:molecular chaperone TorD family protein [Azorhizobium oxalatiphilum]GGF68845.1 DMSO-membrane protein [Azorhizobium oxalatiphilum]
MPKIAHPDLTGGPAARDPSEEAQAMALIANWFSGLLLAPLDAAGIERHRRLQARAFVHTLGVELDCGSAAAALTEALGSGTPEQAEARIAHQYVLLFEGVSGPKSISLYESSYCGEGPGLFNAPFVAMQETLRALDIRVDGPCREPPDHLAVELAALARALLLDRPDEAAGLLGRLRGWAPSVATAVARSPHGGVYAPLFVLLDAFLVSASQPCPIPGPAPLSHQEAPHVHG